MRECGGVESGEPLGQDRAQLGTAPRSLLEDCARERDHRFQVDAPKRGSVIPMAPQLRLEDGLRQRTQQQAVVGRDQVDRPAHDADTHDLAPFEQLRQRLGPEVFEPRPERRVGVVRDLRLQPDEVLDRREWRQRSSLEQQLAGKCRPVERPAAQNLVHRPILTNAGIGAWG